MTKPIINVAAAPTHSEANGEHFAYCMTELAAGAGAKSIGANLTRVPPGKAAFPLHHHYGNEEHFFILSGSGVLRLGEATHAVKAHDYIVNLPGGPECAHQLVNTGTQELVYLAISTLQTPEVVGYPDSAKTGVRMSADRSPDGRFLIADAARKPRTSEEYWKDEDGESIAALTSRDK